MHEHFENVQKHGAVPDLSEVKDGRMEKGSSRLFSRTGGFGAPTTTPNLLIVVDQAGDDDATLHAKIVEVVSNNEVVLSAPATVSVSDALVAWGTDNKAAFQKAIDAASGRATPTDAANELEGEHKPPCGGHGVFVPSGKYLIASHLMVNEVRDLRIVGDGAVIRYPSDDAALEVPPEEDRELKWFHAPGQLRSAINFFKCRRVAVQNLVFEGGRSRRFSDNLGSCVYARATTDLRIQDCTALHGWSLLQQDDEDQDIGTRVTGCSSIDTIGNLKTGDDSFIGFNRFQLSSDGRLDRTDNSHGSSHAIYFHGGRGTGRRYGRQNIVIEGNVFRNVRETGVKVSAKDGPPRNFIITNNVFDDCGSGVEVGADQPGDDEHVSLQVTGNTFINCGTNRDGWNNKVSVRVYGVRSTLVSGNQFYYTRYTFPRQEEASEGNADTSAGGTPKPPYGPGADSVRAIAAGRYRNSDGSYGPACENLQILDNQFHAGKKEILKSQDQSPQKNPPTAKEFAPRRIMIAAIRLEDVGRGSEVHGSVRVAGNQITQVAEVGVMAIGCVGLVVENNMYSNIPTATQLFGNRMPVVRHNQLVSGPQTRPNTQIQLNPSNAFPVIHDNVSQIPGDFVEESTGNPQYRRQGRTLSVGHELPRREPQDYPLLGLRGRSRLTGGKGEIVFAYGSGWVDGDAVEVLIGDAAEPTRIVYTPNASESPGTFSSLDSLIGRLNDLPQLSATDYGSLFGVDPDTNRPLIETGHILVRSGVNQDSSPRFRIRVTGAKNRNRTAGVLLYNGSGRTADWCESRGHGDPNTASTVVWSPCVDWTGTELLEAGNRWAQTWLQVNGYHRENRNDADAGSNAVLHIGSDRAGSPGNDDPAEFRWRLL